jgi:hypothetical protein
VSIVTAVFTVQPIITSIWPHVLLLERLAGRGLLAFKGPRQPTFIWIRQERAGVLRSFITDYFKHIPDTPIDRIGTSLALGIPRRILESALSDRASAIRLVSDMPTNSIWDWTEVVMPYTNTEAHVLAPPVSHLRSEMRSVSSFVALEADVNGVGHNALTSLVIDLRTSFHHRVIDELAKLLDRAIRLKRELAFR